MKVSLFRELFSNGPNSFSDPGLSKSNDFEDKRKIMKNVLYTDTSTRNIGVLIGFVASLARSGFVEFAVKDLKKSNVYPICENDI